MKMKYTNNGITYLSSAIIAGATTLIVNSGSVLPSLSSGEYFYIRLGTDALNEVVKVTARSTNTLTCVATTLGWAANTPVVLTLNSEMLDDIITLIETVCTYTATLSSNGTFTYDVGVTRKSFINPSGADRNYDPSGTFPTGYEEVVINTGGPYNVVFDSSGLSAVITPGTVGRFIYDGADWI